MWIPAAWLRDRGGHYESDEARLGVAACDLTGRAESAGRG